MNKWTFTNNPVPNNIQTRTFFNCLEWNFLTQIKRAVCAPPLVKKIFATRHYFTNWQLILSLSLFLSLSLSLLKKWSVNTDPLNGGGAGVDSVPVKFTQTRVQRMGFIEATIISSLSLSLSLSLSGSLRCNGNIGSFDTYVFVKRPILDRSMTRTMSKVAATLCMELGIISL